MGKYLFTRGCKWRKYHESMHLKCSNHPKTIVSYTMEKGISLGPMDLYFYIKHRDFTQVQILKTASWVVKRVMEYRDVLMQR